MKENEAPDAAQSGLSDSEKIDKLIELIDGNSSKDEIFGLANELKEEGRFQGRSATGSKMCL